MGGVRGTINSPIEQHLTFSSARATSAAPTYFKPLCHNASNQTYVDGAVYHNNPIQIADKERKLIWPNMKDEYPDILVSIGTAFNSKPRTTSEVSSTPRSGILSHGKSLYKIAKNHIESSLNSEKTWETYLSILPLPYPAKSRYVRLNPRIIEDPPGLDEVHRMHYIRDVTRDQFKDDDRVRQVALQLIASSFYFEKLATAELKDDNTVDCKGSFLYSPH